MKQLYDVHVRTIVGAINDDTFIMRAPMVTIREVFNLARPAMDRVLKETEDDGESHVWFNIDTPRVVRGGSAILIFKERPNA